MTTAYEIPLSAVPQDFSIDLGSTTYQLTVTYNGISEVWVLDIADVSGNPILQGIQIVTGCDLLEQYGYLNFEGQLIAQTDHDPDAPPTQTNLGTTGHLYFVTTP
jgi:uncharacterized protein DUF6983